MRHHQRNNHYYKGKKRPTHSEFMKENNPMDKEDVRKKQLEVMQSEEFRKECSKRNTGENNPFYGKKHTEETKEKLKNIFSLKVEKICMKTLNVIKVYDSAKDASIEMCNKNRGSSITSVCRGESKQFNEYYWEYNDEKIKEKYKNDKKKYNLHN